MNKSESKYFNTAARMDEALISLLARKDFAYITVREICETAGVNRSTFYLHYENTGDLLEEAVRYTEERFFGCFPAKQQSIRQKLHTCPPEQLILITPEYLTPYLTFIRDNRLIYCTALAKPELWRSEQRYNASTVPLPRRDAAAGHGILCRRHHGGHRRMAEGRLPADAGRNHPDYRSLHFPAGAGHRMKGCYT